MSKTNKLNRNSQLRLENLETRALMSGVTLSGGWLDIKGSHNTNDQAIVVDQSPAQPVGTVFVYFNGQSSVFPKQLIYKGVKFHGYGGNDSFSSNLLRPVHAWGGSGNDTISGSSFADKLRGGSGEDVISGNGGNDSIWGGTHNDTIHGGSGNDWVTGQSGNDLIYGDDGNDKLYGYTGNDTVHGGDGNDTISGWTGYDYLTGGDNNDKIWGHAGNDFISGQGGNDWMNGGSEDDNMYGGDGNDTMYGSSGEDSMHGGDGNDSMLGGSWSDLMYGDDGNDWMTGQSGNDTLRGGDNNDTMYGYTGHDLLIGDDGNDVLSGWSGNDMLYGREGNDTLYGHSGRDGLMGGNGLDYVNGGSNSDRYLTIGDHSEIVSMSGGDATIRFTGPKAWSYGEIEMIDGGLAKLHERTGNTVLLADPEVAYDPADPKGPRMTFIRDFTDYNSEGDPIGNVGLNQGNGNIRLFDSLFNAGAYHPAGLAGRVAQYTIHEIGHFWDSPSENSYNLSGQNVVTYFRADSGWRNDLGAGSPGDEKNSGGQTYVKAGSANYPNSWWYLKNSSFVTDYARVSPAEDFSDTLAAIVMGSDFYRNGSDTANAPTAKRAWLNAWLNNV